VETRRLATGALITGLCLAAATAVTALMSGEFEDAHWRVIGTSLGFAVFSAVGASGSAAWQQADGWRLGLGVLTVSSAVVAFVLLVIAMWAGGDAAEGLWKTFGVSGLLALWCSHASLVLRSQRSDDPSLVSLLVWTSIVAGAFDMVIADTAILDDIDEGFVRFAGAVLVVMVLSTALPLLVRRVAATHSAVAPDAYGAEPKLTMAHLADEIAAAASRLDRAATAVDARREAASLRELAERARR
jgi:hypothetical protein